MTQMNKFNRDDLERDLKLVFKKHPLVIPEVLELIYRLKSPEDINFSGDIYINAWITPGAFDVHESRQ